MQDSRRSGLFRPRVLALDLARLASGTTRVEPRAWSATDPALDRLGCLSGSALGVATLLERARLEPESAAPLVISVGPCVRRGLPTASRASLASRAPLTGLFTEGQVGTDLGARLAAFVDAVVLAGRTELTGAVLELAPSDGGRVAVTLHAAPELVGRAPRAVAEALRERLGPCAVLCTGPGADRGLPFASLAACGDPPSFVGRGGLGAVLGRLGLKAVAVTAEPRAAADADPDAGAATGHAELRRRLAASPRLRARSEGGTLELAPARAARGELGAQGDEARRVAGAFVRDAAERAVERKGCRGCPTPCGWVFATPEEADGGAAKPRGAHFSALDALGLRLGLERFEDAHALLGRCDALGVDAKEVGLVLALLCAAHESGRLAGPSPRGDRAALERALDELGSGTGDASAMALGAAGMARALGFAEGGEGGEGVVAKGQAARRERNLAAVLGQCVSSRGADPMRTFPFLVGEGVDAGRAARLLAPYPVTRAALDPERPEETGRVVAWHEDFAAAVDASGFCAFSAAGLLTDGLCTLDELAAWIAPEAPAAVGTRDVPDGAGAALLAAGASIVLAQRELNALWGAPPDADRPAWARAELERPGMWDEYRALRGLDEAGRPTPAALGALATPAVLGLGGLARAAAAAPRAAADEGAPAGPRARGTVTLRSFGPLSRALGDEAVLELPLPAPAASVLAEAARQVPAAARWLLRDGRPVPAVQRGGRRLEPADPVHDGDVLDLVLAISGGAA